MYLVDTSLGGRKISQAFFIQCFLVLVSFLLVSHYQKEFSKTNGLTVHIPLRSELVEHTVLGFKNFSADLFWLRVIQEIDFKDSKTAVTKGWVFHILDTVTTLDPRYKMVYQNAASVLSVVIHDKVGAGILYERGVKVFPDLWDIAYKAGYLYLYELKDCKRAAELFNQAADHGAPIWVHALAGRLYAKAGQFQVAKNVLEDGLEKYKGTDVEIEYRKRLNQLTAAYNDPHNTTLIDGLKCQATAGAK